MTAPSGTPLLDEANRGEFDPLFVKNLTCDCSFITHHTTSGTGLAGHDFLTRKGSIAAALREEIERADLDRTVRIRAMKVSL